MIIFETARYGRNQALVAARCDIPFTRNCDVDVHFPLNRACAGRQKCSLAVNTGFFGDPCGYEEFLTVSYRCVPGTQEHHKINVYVTKHHKISLGFVFYLLGVSNFSLFN